MDNLLKSIRNARIAAIILSVMLAAGIPLAAVGGSKQIWPVLGVGIAFIVFGFYGCPIAWVKYGEICGLKRMVYAIESEHCYTVREIASQLNKSEKFINKQLDVCFDKFYLVGYIRTENGVALNRKVAFMDEEHTAQCKYCGASFTYKGDKAVCPYCGGSNSPYPNKQ